MHTKRWTRHAIVAISCLTVIATIAGPTNGTSAQRAEVRTSALPTGVRYRILERRPGAVQLVVTDRSGRNIATEFPGGDLPTEPKRTIAVTVLFPPGSDGRPLPDTTWPVMIFGGYRAGTLVRDCPPEGAPDAVFVCIGFHLADDAGRVEHRDIPNDPGDISAVLDVLAARPGIAGTLRMHDIVYRGASRGGMAGLFLVHPLLRDPRITAIVAELAFAPEWVPAFSQRATWDSGPSVLMINGLKDDRITYELAKKTVRNASGSKRLTFISVPEMGHGFGQCNAVQGYSSQWAWWKLGLEPKPRARSVERSGCGHFGILPGGTTGDGGAAVFRPAP